jgi:wyosine [tRNA(Phe)-imidazoG37] synthetase (radical SAM superfamily)
MNRDNVTSDHRRQWGQCHYVYPVISRRARGLSIGVNLNPDKRCNFGCLYCQVDRYLKRDLRHVDLGQLRDELEMAMEEAISGRLWDDPRFGVTPDELRRINDIAFSGDGEPTCLPQFDQAVRIAADVKNDNNRPDVKIVVITNATQLESKQVDRALPILDANNGELWCKLDAGTESWFQTVNRPGPILMADILRGIKRVSRGREVVIQTLWFRVDGVGPSSQEIEAWCDRLDEILAAGGRLRLVQIHTVARSPLSPRAAHLPDEQLDAIGRRVRERLPQVNVEVYYGADVPPQSLPPKGP